MKDIEQVSPMHQILQMALAHPELEPHFGHLRNHFMPSPVEEANVPQSESKQMTKKPVSSKNGSNTPLNSMSTPNNESDREVSVNVAPEAPQITVNLPEPKVTVNVAAPPAPEVNVHVDAPEKLEIPTPTTKVNIEPQVNKTPKSVETFHDQFGNLHQIVETYDSGEKVSSKEGNKWVIDDRRRETS